MATQEVEAAAKDDKGDEQVLTDDSAEYRPVFFKGTSTVNFTCTVNELGNIKFTIPLKNNELELEASGAVGETKESGGAVSSSSVDIVLKDAITFDEFTHVAFDIRNVDGKWAAAAAMSDDRAYESIVTVYVNGQYAGKKLLWERPNLEQVMHTGNPEHVHPLFFGHVPSAFATAGSGQVAGFAPLSGCYVEDVRIFVDGFEDVEENKAAMGGEADVANKAYNAVPMSVHAAFSAVPRHQRVCRNFFDTLLPVLLQDLFVSADDSERMMAIQHNAAEKEAVADSAGLAEDGGVLFSPSGTQWRFDGLGGDAGQSAKLRFTTDTAMELSVYQGDELQRKTLYVCSPSETSNVLQFKEVAEGGGGEEKKEEGATEPKLSFVTADCMKLQWPGSSSSFYCGWRRLEEPLVNIDETNTDELPTNADDANRLLSALECFNLSRNSWCLLSQGGGAGGQVAEAADKPYLLHQSSNAFHEDTMLVCREEGGERASTGFDRARRALQQLLVGRAILTKQQHVQRGMGAVGGTDGKNKSIMFPEAAAFIFAEDVSSTLRPNIKVTPSKDMVVYYEQTLLESGEGLRIGWSADEYQPSDGLPTDAQVFETAHQYTDNMNEKNSVSFAEDPVRGAVKRIAICFDPQSESEQNYDYLRFLPAEDAVDQDGKEGDAVPFYIKDKFSGDKGEVNWPSKNVMFIEADRFVTQFITDGSGTKWGYRFAARPVYTEAPKRNEAVQQVIDQARGAAGERVKAALSADSPPDGVRIVESSHEYSCNMSEETLIEFEGADAIAIIFDERCRSEHNYDFLRLRRNAGSDEKPWIQEKFSGSQGSENWPSAEPVFVEASKFVAYFQSDGSNVEWGYRFACAPVMLPANSPPLYDPEEMKAEDALKVELLKTMASSGEKESLTGAMLVESPHPYNNNSDDEERVHFPGAVRISVFFDKQCRSEKGYDYLVLRKESGGGAEAGKEKEGNFWGPSEKYMGRPGSDTDGVTWPFDAPVEIEGDTFFTYFKSDGSTNDWGYKMVCIAWYGDDAGDGARTSGLMGAMCPKNIPIMPDNPNLTSTFNLWELDADVQSLMDDSRRPINADLQSRIARAGVAARGDAGKCAKATGKHVGFCQKDWIDFSYESQHPYMDNMDEETFVSFPGATELTVMFDPKNRTESCDTLTFRKQAGSNDNSFGQKAGQGPSYWEDSLKISGDRFWAFFHSDGSVNDWGYRFTVIPTFPEKAGEDDLINLGGGGGGETKGETKSETKGESDGESDGDDKTVDGDGKSHGDSDDAMSEEEKKEETPAAPVVVDEVGWNVDGLVCPHCIMEVCPVEDMHAILQGLDGCTGFDVVRGVDRPGPALELDDAVDKNNAPILGKDLNYGQPTLPVVHLLSRRKPTVVSHDAAPLRGSLASFAGGFAADPHMVAMAAVKLKRGGRGNNNGTAGVVAGDTATTGGAAEEKAEGGGGGASEEGGDGKGGTTLEKGGKGGSGAGTGGQAAPEPDPLTTLTLFDPRPGKHSPEEKEFSSADGTKFASLSTFPIAEPVYMCDGSHPLEVLGTSQDNGWSCSGMNFPGGCKKGCTGFRQSTGWDRWRCTQCDFDLCDQCLESKRVPEGSTEGTGEVLGWATIDAHNGEEHCVFLRQAVDGPFGIWGDSGEWKERDVVGIGVDFEQKEISFWHNRKFQGVAFRGEDVPGPFWDADGGGFYPVISLTPTSVDSLASLRVDFNPEEPPDGYRTFADALGEAAKARGGESKGESFEEAKGTEKVAAEIVRTVVNGAAETVASGGSVAVEGKRGESKGEGGGGVEVGGGGGVFDVQCITFDLFATRGDENEFEEATEKTWVNVNRLAVNEGDDEKQTRFMLSMFKSNAEALESLARSEARQVARAICCRGLDAAGGTQGKNEFDLSCRLALHVDDAETVAWAIRAIMEVTDDARYTEVFKRNVMQRLATAEMDGLVRFPDFFGLCNRGNNAFLDMSKSLFAQVSKDAEGKKFWGGHRPVAKVKGSSRTTRAKALEVATATLGSGRIKDGVAAIFESAHNYADNMSEETTISFPGASAIAIVFDAETHTERNYDFLRFRREAGSDEDPWIKEKFTGPQGPENWPSAEPVYIEADSCIAYFHSDSSGNEWGYRFVAVPVYDGAGGNSTVGGREPLIKQGGRAAQEPFEPRKQMSEQISFPGADSITITFDRKNCEMPSPYDFLSLLRSEVSVEDPTSVRERLLTRGDNQASADMMCWGDAPGGMYRGPKEAWPTSVTFNTSEFTLFYSCGDSLHGVSGKTSRDKVLEIAAAALLKGGEEGKDEKVAKVFESKHNYEDNTDEETTISFPGASAIAIVFDAETRTEQNYDFLRFRREAGSDTKPWIRDKFTGAQGLENWPAKEPVYIEADSCVAYFHSDSSGNEWGYRFVAVPVYDGAGSYSITATPHFKDSDADRHLCDMALKVMYLSAGSGSARNSDGSPLGKPKRGSKPLLNRSISMGGVGGGGGGGGSTQDVVYLNEKMLLSDATDSSAPQRIFIPGASELVVTFDGTEGACVCSGGKDQRIEFYSNKNCTTKGRVSYRNKSDQMELAVFTGAESYAGESFRVTGDTVFVKVSYGMEQWGTVV